MRIHLSRKNFIALALVFFYCVCVIYCGLCIEASTYTIMGRNNLIKNISTIFFQGATFNVSYWGWTLVASIDVYIFLIVAALMYEMNLARYYTRHIFTKKWVIVYVVTFLVLGAIGFGIGIAANIPGGDVNPKIGASFYFLWACLLLGLLVFICGAGLVFAICSLYVNFKHIDEPYRFFGKKTSELEEDEAKTEEEEDEAKEEQGELSSSFGEGEANGKGGAGGAGGAGGTGEGGEGTLSDSPLKDKERVFPGLCSIDYEISNFTEPEFNNEITLEALCTNFRNYLAKAEHLYFDLKTIREFISGLGTSRLIILEGLSGTGKSSLARYFSTYIGEDSYFEAVQATWRDRTSILGYYNDFSKTYNETEFLKRLYEASYKDHHINVMVLDELNISRIEYYFADFLSVLEYPDDKWILKIMQLPFDFDAPEHLEKGYLKIPVNTWFIGTANKDDSTYTITDKVYDRAISIEFDTRNEPFEVEGEVSTINLSFDRLKELFARAIKNKNNQLTANDLKKFNVITSYTYNTFDLTFGNRIMHQIETLVPIYVACGGDKLDALDFMFSKKVVSKLEGRFEDYIKKGLLTLKGLIDKTYGSEAFPQTKHTIDKLVKKL